MRGGVGSEYYVSLKTGASVLANLPRDKYEPHDILISREGEWFIDGRPTAPEKLMQYIDVVFNGLHGEFGEDGKVQSILDLFGVPYTGSTAIPSAIGMNKDLAKKHFQTVDIRVPRGVTISRNEEVGDVLAKIKEMTAGPFVVKPVSGGSSIGLSFVKKEEDLIPAIECALNFSEVALVEEFVRGREMTVGVIDSRSGQDPYATPLLEILLPEEILYDFDLKYSNLLHSVGQPRVSDRERRELESIALKAHKHLGARHYARYDFILTEHGPCLLEVNTLPSLSDVSLLSKSLQLQGLSVSEFSDYIIKLALQKK